MNLLVISVKRRIFFINIKLLLQLRTLKIWKHLKTIIFSVWYLQGKSAFEQLFENWNTVSNTLGI